MKNQLRVLLLIITFGILCSGCSNIAQPPPIPLNRNFDLTDNELSSLEIAANQGDGLAAYRLFQYYAFFEFNEVQYTRWLTRAAKLGYRPAIESLGNILCESSDPKERRRGRELLREVGAEDPTVMEDAR